MHIRSLHRCILGTSDTIIPGVGFEAAGLSTSATVSAALLVDGRRQGNGFRKPYWSVKPAILAPSRQGEVGVRSITIASAVVKAWFGGFSSLAMSIAVDTAGASVASVWVSP